MTAHIRILVTVGTELPFDRLVHAVDRWAAERGRTGDVFAQIGESSDPPANIEWTRFLDGPSFVEQFHDADLVVAHAGMGTILSALQNERPLLVMPRRADLGEHRNDHQLATVKRLSPLGRVDVAFTDEELAAQLDAQGIQPKPPIGPHADASLIAAVRQAIRGTAAR